MSLEPLTRASPIIFAHATAALAAFVLGLVQLLSPKGTRPHRVMGWTWVLLLAAVALSSFGISTIRQFGPFSVIHLLSILTLVTLPIAVLAARRHDRQTHARVMIMLFVGALVIAGGFTLWPGRIMHQVVFGPNPSS
jgi:uncharacterized membrane protein